MRVVIEPQSDDIQHRKLRLGPNQQVQVGNTEWAEFHVEDPQLAEVHFILETSNNQCIVRENPNGKGVYVNGVRVHEAILKHGDDLFAGSTHFRVAVEDTTVAGPGKQASADLVSRTNSGKKLAPPVEEPAQAKNASEPAASTARPAGKRSRQGQSAIEAAASVRRGQSAPPHAAPGQPLSARPVSPAKGSVKEPEPGFDRRFAGRMCHSGFACFQELRLLPSEVASRLGKVAPPFMILNTARLERQFAEQFESTTSLVSADQTASGSLFSVQFQALTSLKQIALLDSLWGRDAIIVGFSRQPISQLMSAIRRHVTWFVSPSVLRSQLDQADRRFAANLVGLFDAILMESQGGTDWLVYSRPETSSPWISAGFPATIQL